MTRTRAHAHRPARPRRRPARLKLEAVEDRLAPAVTATFTDVNDWGDGFQGAIRISNDRATPILNWRLEFDFSHQITQIWNGAIASHVGDHYVVNNAGYNGTIPANGSVEFGFLGTPGHVTTPPSHFALNGVPLDGTPLPTVSVGDVSLTEGDSGTTTAGFPVTLSAPSAYTITVRYATGNGTAKVGADYRSAGDVLTFQPGETQKTVPVTVLGDTLDEDDETFTLTLTEPAGADLGTPRGTATIQDDDSPPTLQVTDVTVQEPSSAGVDPGFFHTSGTEIVDAKGRPVRIAGVNWFGMETPSYAPHGLWVRNYKDMMDQMVQLGFNTIRLPFCNQLFDPGVMPNNIDYAINPDLRGLNGLQVIDKIVDYAGQVGLRIFLDQHRSDAGGGPNGSGLWYTNAYPESRWIDDWTMLAQHFADNPTVIGADLNNEPHGNANWGGGGANDWRLAAERAGNAILAVNPNWLIIVEGVEQVNNKFVWWGGNLMNAAAFPVRLNVDARLVYSPHDYPASVFQQPWFSDPNYPDNLYNLWDSYWGHLYRQGTAPVLLGEFGTKLETNTDKLWLTTMAKYLAGDMDGDGTNDLTPGQLGISWTWWSWNPDSGDTGGILEDDWTTPIQAKLDALKDIQYPFGSAGGPVPAAFTVNLSAASGKTVTVNYTTNDDSAAAGSDYTGKSGTLTFAPGETSKTIGVPVLPDSDVESDETFTLDLSGASGATVADGTGVGTILDAGQPTPPTIRVGDVRVTEGDAGTTTASFPVTLSAPSSDTVTVDYSTSDGSAVDVQDYQAVGGTVTFAPGETSKTVQVPIVGDKTPEGTETFRLVLSDPSNAVLGTAQGTGTVVDNDASVDGVQVTFNARSDWGAGFVADMAIVNNGASAINGWTLEFDLDRDITNIWNAVIVNRTGSHYTIRNAPWNPNVPSHGRVEFGYQGATGNVGSGPTGYILNGVPLS